MESRHCIKIIPNTTPCYYNDIKHKLMDELDLDRLHEKRLTASILDWPDRIIRSKTKGQFIEHKLRSRLDTNNIKQWNVSVRYSNEQTQYLYDYEISMIIDHSLVYIICTDCNTKIIEYMSRIGLISP